MYERGVWLLCAALEPAEVAEVVPELMNCLAEHVRSAPLVVHDPQAAVTGAAREAAAASAGGGAGWAAAAAAGVVGAGAAGAGAAASGMMAGAYTRSDFS